MSPILTLAKRHSFINLREISHFDIKCSASLVFGRSDDAISLGDRGYYRQLIEASPWTTSQGIPEGARRRALCESARHFGSFCICRQARVQREHRPPAGSET